MNNRNEPIKMNIQLTSLKIGQNRKISNLNGETTKEWQRQINFMLDKIKG